MRTTMIRIYRWSIWFRREIPPTSRAWTYLKESPPIPWSTSMNRDLTGSSLMHPMPSTNLIGINHFQVYFHSKSYPSHREPNSISDWQMVISRSLFSWFHRLLRGRCQSSSHLRTTILPEGTSPTGLSHWTTPTSPLLHSNKGLTVSKVSHRSQQCSETSLQMGWCHSLTWVDQTADQ